MKLESELPRYIVPIVFYWYVGKTMWRTMGHYAPTAGSFTILFFLTVLAMMWRPAALGFLAEPKRRERIWTALLCVVSLAGCYMLAHRPLVIYANLRSPFLGVFHGLTWVAAAIAAVLAILSFGAARWGARSRSVFCALAAAAIALLLAAQCFVPLISPKPWIDVWVSNTAAVDHFIHGLNPYTQNYSDIYRGAYDYKPGFFYFPGLLYWLAPFLWLFGDIRYGFVLANLLIAVGAVLLGRKKKASWQTSLMLGVLWLSFPVSFFVLEQAWIDTILGAMAMLAFLGIAHRRWVFSGIFLGVACAVKQYGCLIAFIALIQICKDAHWRPALKTALAAAVIFILAALPFAILDFGSFYDSTIGGLSSSLPRRDAYNATAYFAREFGWMIPAFGRLAISVLSILGAAFFLSRKKSPDLSDAATGIFVIFGVSFLFGKWAFCNYYYLLASMLLVHLVARSGELTSEPRID